jgi:D-alanyl-D-alanine carboxypeptidase (penicillin-binding protein 5/6)
LGAFLAFLTIFLTLCSLFSLPSGAEEPVELDGYSSVLLYHNESGKILFSRGENEKVPAGPASRMAAALVFLEHYGSDLEKIVTVDRRVSGLASSTMNPGLKNGEELTVYQLLCGMLIANSDDAVCALAFDLYQGAADAPERLLEAINGKAAALGMTDTVFVNVTGADPKNTEMLASQSTLSDLLTLSLAFQKQRALVEICAIDDITLPATNKSGERRLLTRNYLLSAKRIGGYTYKYATGLAAAEGALSGYHTVATAKIGAKTFTCISVGAYEKYAAFQDAARLFDWANGAFSYQKVLDRTTVFGEVSVRLSDDSDYVTVVPDRDLSAFLPKDRDLYKDIRVEPIIELSDLTAPVAEGLIVGSVKVFYKNEELGSARLVTTSSLSMSNNRYYLYMAQRFFETPIFLTLLLGVVLFSVLCVLFAVISQPIDT